MPAPLRVLLLLLLGATLGTALDHLHVAGGVLADATPFCFAQALLDTQRVDGWSPGFAIHVLPAAGVGTGVELLLTHRGAFHDLRPTPSTAALWLPGLSLWGASVGRALHAAMSAPRAPGGE